MDVLDPIEPMTLGFFIREASSAVKNIENKGLLPVIAGGTIYYLRHWLLGPPEAPPVDDLIRKKVEEQVRTMGIEEAYKKLCEVDETSGKRIHPNDHYRIKRALEVWEQSGKPLSTFSQTSRTSIDQSIRVVSIEVERDVLRKTLRQRCVEMFKNGWVDEVATLLKMGLPPDSEGLRTLGYAQITRELTAGRNPELIVDEIVHLTQHYAKRQMTFLRSLPEVTWIPPVKDHVLKILDEMN